MWTRGVAIRPVPSHAVIDARTIELVRATFAEDEGSNDAQRELDQAFARFEATQPALSARLSDALDQKPALDDTALALGYFLGVAVWLMFERQFGARLSVASEMAIKAAQDSFDLESELRATRAEEALEVEDVVAREQPALMAFVNEHVDVALESGDELAASERRPSAEEVDVDDVYAIYRAVIIEILALSHAVAPHPGAPIHRGEVLA